jgi:predicted RNase H-like HicB family nuclease
VSRKKRTKKERRHSGRITPRRVRDFNLKYLIEAGLEPQEVWNGWQEHRDGFRGNDDRKQFKNTNMSLGKYFKIKHWNEKLKRLILRRKARKQNPKNRKVFNNKQPSFSMEKEIHDFTVLIEQDEDGLYVASVPDIQGCYTQGKTIPEVLERIKEAIEVCLEVEEEEIKPMKFIGIQQMKLKKTGSLAQ